MRLSLHSKQGLGKKYVDNETLWIKTEDMVRRAMNNGNVPYVESQDEAAFYGPKIDVQVWSAIGREFTLATNQVDFAVPKRFGLTYTNKQNQQETPGINRAGVDRFSDIGVRLFGGSHRIHRRHQ